MAVAPWPCAACRVAEAYAGAMGVRHAALCLKGGRWGNRTATTTLQSRTTAVVVVVTAAAGKECESSSKSAKHGRTRAWVRSAGRRQGGGQGVGWGETAAAQGQGRRQQRERRMRAGGQLRHVSRCCACLDVIPTR